MIHSALKLSRAVTSAAKTVWSGHICSKPFLCDLQSPPSRLVHAKIDGANVNPVALQMIDYALSLANSKKSDETYAQGVLVLEQCLASQSSEGQDIVNDNTKGIVLLAMSNLLYGRGKNNDAIDQLRIVEDLPHSSFRVKVAAAEALVGLNLELGLDAASSSVADKCLGWLGKDEQESSSAGLNAAARAKAIKGLVELVRGDVRSAESLFQEFQDHKGYDGHAALSYGEFLHATQNFSLAKDVYQKVVQGAVDSKDFADIRALASCNMASQEVLLAANCALGQLESHTGNFADAEETLTGALNKAEQLFGSRHPKVGIILTCLALMFRNKATQEHSSSLLIQEGLYRRAIELLKAPPLELEGGEKMGLGTDIIALARGGYGEALCVQQNRKGEGEKLKMWAEAAWRNRRMSLSEALKISKSSDKVPIIDARIGRVV